MNLLIKNAHIVNEGELFFGAVEIEGERITHLYRYELGKEPDSMPEADTVVDAEGGYLMPGVIDTHVHFRDPGLTEKADFATESRAAAAGGVTSVIDMPNTQPQTTTLALLEEKEQMASEKSVVNYGFMLGATNDNIDELLAIDPRRYAAIKLFLGSSTGNMLVNNAQKLDYLFEKSKKLIVAHCEDESIIKNNTIMYRAEVGGTDKESAESHPKIRSTEACYVSTYKAVERARKYGTHLHIAHVSTATELNLFSNQSLDEKHITAEVTPNHLWFDDRDYPSLGNKIKCNPSIKSNDDRLALWAALYDGLIDTIGSDHAPHTLQSKEKPYFDAPSGIPSIQHTLLMMLEPFFATPESLDPQIAPTWFPLLVEKMCHNPALLFGIEERGFIREGYYADLVLVRPAVENKIEKKDLLYKCQWSPLEGMTFHSRVEMTLVDGQMAYRFGDKITSFGNKPMLLSFNK